MYIVCQIHDLQRHEKGPIPIQVLHFLITILFLTCLNSILFLFNP